MKKTSDIALIGYPVSNYFNIVRAGLIEKQLEHTIIQRSAAQDEEFLAINPMGKIPVLRVGDDYISETTAILEFLDDVSPKNSMRPAAPLTAARMRQIINIVQIYCETPARTLYPGVFMGQSWTNEQADAAKATIERAISALAKLVSNKQFLIGDTLTQADIFAYYNLLMVERVWQSVFGASVLDRLPLSNWLAHMDQRESTVIVMRDFEQYLIDYLNDKGSDYRLEPRYIIETQEPNRAGANHA